MCLSHEKCLKGLDQRPSCSQSPPVDKDFIVIQKKCAQDTGLAYLDQEKAMFLLTK